MFEKNRGALKWLFENSKPIIGSIILLTLLGVAVSFISVEFAMAARELLDVATGESTKPFYLCVVRILCLLIAEVGLESFYNIYAVRLSSKNKNRLQKNLFSSLMKSDYATVGSYHSGELVNRLTSDINIINSNIIDIVPAFVMLVTSVLFSFVAMMKLDMSLSLICLALGPVVIVTSVLYGRKMKKLHKACQESDGKTRSFMQECIQNVLVIKAFGSEKRTERHTEILQDINYRLNMKRGYISIGVNLLYYLAMTVAYYFAVAWCAYKISIGIMTVGTFTAIVQLVNSMQSPFREISGTVSQFFATCASAERVIELENIPEDDTCDEEVSGFESIVIENMDFSYGEEKVFENASFTLKKGNISVITGYSGQGKSTFLKLLMGIYKPSKGSMQVATDHGTCELGASTRSLFAYVPQGNMIISGTLRENIAFFSDVDEDTIVNAAKCAEIYDYIQTLPLGLDTPLGEGGLGLSEGQTQRIAVARALCTSAPVILLDEATSALDDETEAKILKNINSLMDRTSVIITHRRAALDIATVKYSLENGIIAEK